MTRSPRSPINLLALSALCLFVASSAGAQHKKRLAFEQIFNSAEPHITESLPIISSWIDDDHFLETRRNGGEAKPTTYLIDAGSGKESVAHELGDFRDLVGPGIDPDAPVASNESYSKLIYLKENDLYYLNIETRQFRRLTRAGVEPKNPTFSPAGNFVAFTRDNNLFAVELSSSTEFQYTTDGAGAIYNGWTSWLYYEEILGRASRHCAFWWSPDGMYLAFYRFDDSRVPNYPDFSAEGQHGRLENAHYPEVGDPNPEVRIGIVPVQGGQVVWSDLDPLADQYFGTPFWTPDSKSLWVQWMNRRQDSLRVYAVNSSSGQTHLVYEEFQKSWVDWLAPIRFLSDGSGFILRTDKDGWMHLYLHAMDGRLWNRLSGGAWSVVDLLGVDERVGIAFFTAKKESSTRTDLYSVRLDGSALSRLSFGPYSHTVKLSPTGKYFVTTYSNASTPQKMSLYSGGGRLVRELADAKRKEFDEYELARTELFTIPTHDGYALPAEWTLPLDLDRTKKYPVVITVYGGPNSPSVSDTWKGIGNQWLAIEGLITMSVDHRGSGHFGKAGAAVMKGNLGKWEMNDYEEAVQWLKSTGFVDTTKICITGGSYGGYVTCLALTEGADYFTHGIALYSVTDWKLYDSHYTERYMGIPAENPQGYTDSSPLTYVNKYKGLLRIVHGAMDDNVHLQNSLQLAGKLEDLRKHFELMIYPEERHGWGGAKAVHLQNETYRFYYLFLLDKPFPEKLFENAKIPMRRMR